MRSDLGRTLAVALVIVGCGGAPPSTTSTASTSGDERVDEAPTVAATSEAPSASWLAALSADGMLTYRVRVNGGEERNVRMLVQQRVERGTSIAVRLAPIGTPLEDTPVYPQWLVGSSDGLRGLEEHAAFTAPGFVPIDGEGRLLTEAASSEDWRVEPAWLRSGMLASGAEAAAGWSFVERLDAVDDPLHAERCVRLEREEGSLRTRQIVCADHGMIELSRSEGEREIEHWRLVAVGPRPSELH